MKRNIKILSLFLAVLLAFSVFPFNNVYAVENTENTYEPDTYIPEEEYTEEIYEGTGSLEYAFDGTFIRDYVDNETLDEAGHVARINEEEELNTYVFLNRDGTKSVYYMDDNVRYVDENGETVEKDLTIIRKNKGYTLKANDVKLWFPDVLSDGISVKYDEFHLTLYPQGVADTEEVIIDEYERITYPGVFGENTVLAYTPTLSGLKEDIILSEYTGQLSYDFLIHTHGMRILEEEGKYIVKKPGNGNKETFELGAVQIYDSAGNFCVGEMKITEQNNGSKYILTLIAPEEFLTDPNTVYPVTIDPTITVSGANAIEDSVVYSGTPNANYGTYYFLPVGYNDSTYGVSRAVFRLSALCSSEDFLLSTADNIQSAAFYVWDGTGTSGRTINLHALNSYMWTESGITWNNYPTHSVEIMSSANMAGATYTAFDITDLVKRWCGGTSPHFGFALVNPDETNSANKKVPCSSEYNYTDRRPYAVVTYSPTAVIKSSVNRVNVGNAITLTVEANDDITMVAWTTGDSSIATVSQTGVVTGVKTGNVTIAAHVIIDGIAYHAYKNLYVTIPDGVYLIKNAASHKYADITGGSVSSGAAIEQQAFDGDNTQRWNIRYSGSGYYTIWSTASTSYYYMGVSGDSSSSGAAIVLRTGSVYLGMQWRILTTTSGNFMLLPRSGESNNKALALASNTTSPGVKLKQYVYSDNSSLDDEWSLLRTDLYVCNLQVCYDNAYEERFSDAHNRIGSELLTLQEKYINEFGIWVNITSQSLFRSYADECANPYNEQCSHAENGECANSTNSANGLYNLHHKNYFNIAYRIGFPDTNTTLKVAFVGHVTCVVTAGKHDTNAYRGLTFPQLGLSIITNFDSIPQETKTLLHEFGHLYGAPDHYDGTSCLSTDEMNALYGKIFSKDCIYGENRSTQEVLNDYTICQGCREWILENQNKYNHTGE